MEPVISVTGGKALPVRLDSGAAKNLPELELAKKRYCNPERQASIPPAFGCGGSSVRVACQNCNIFGIGDIYAEHRIFMFFAQKPPLRQIPEFDSELRRRHKGLQRQAGWIVAVNPA